MNYFITKLYYRDTDDIENVIKKKYGSNAFVCDFDDLTPQIINQLNEKYNLNEHGISHAIVKFRGNLKNYGRQYFVEVHRKQADLNGWLVHKRFNMQNYYLDLGSWFGLYMPVIVVKIKEKPMKFDLDTCCPICLTNFLEADKESENIKHCKYGCGNCYHNDCFLLLNNKCAMCRAKLSY